MHFGTRIYNSILVVIQLRIVISVLLNESSQPLYPPCFNATLCSYALNLCPISCVGSDDIILIMVSLHKIRQRRSLSESSPWILLVGMYVRGAPKYYYLICHVVPPYLLACKTLKRIFLAAAHLLTYVSSSLHRLGRIYISYRACLGLGETPLGSSFLSRPRRDHVACVLGLGQLVSWYRYASGRQTDRQTTTCMHVCQVLLRLL